MKPSEKERINKALEESQKKTTSKNRVCKLVKKALEERGINGKPEKVKLLDLENFRIPKSKKDNCNSLIFIQFSKSGHIAVVGAGTDYVTNPLYNGNKSTAKILEKLRNYNGKRNYDDFQFDVDSVILIPVEDLESRGYNNASSILKSRNGVEQYIGEYLVNHGVAILNYYQHWNFTKSVFELID